MVLGKALEILIAENWLSKDGLHQLPKASAAAQPTERRSQLPASDKRGRNVCTPARDARGGEQTLEDVPRAAVQRHQQRAAAQVLRVRAQLEYGGRAAGQNRDAHFGKAV